jgi:uncharacterized protein (DUF1800 family)
MPPRPMAPAFRLVILAALLLGGLAAQTVQPDTALSADEHAARFLAQATFGPTTESIAELRNLGYDYNAWIDREVAKPATLAAPLVKAALAAGNFTAIANSHNRRARNQVMIAGSDQLRQRVAYALSQIFVISDNISAISSAAEGSSSYYDMLAQDSFGSFRQLLMDVSRHPMMGRYLTHYRNRKANTTTGTRPDENYAREAMQLFTIGLYLLNPDGTYQSVTNGRATESYTNEQITEFARVFTGFTDEDNNPAAVGTGTGRTDFPSATQNYTQAMKMWDGQHDTGAKTLLSYPGVRKTVLPAGQSGLQDVNDAIDNLVEHPNTGPFIGRLLIQRLVTSNPSDAYVGRVAAAFANNGRSQRGDLVAVIKAILLDQEARNLAFVLDPQHGKLQEPFLRVTNLLRAFRHTTTGSYLPYDFTTAVSETTLGQYPLSSPSVFNFYLPDYEPPGAIGNAGLVGPEFQILNSVFGITTPNNLYNLIHNATVGSFSLDLAPQAALSDNATALVDNVDLLLAHGTLSGDTRAKVVAAVNGVTAAMVPSGSTLALTKARVAVYLVAVSPDCAVLK